MDLMLVFFSLKENLMGIEERRKRDFDCREENESR